MITLSKLALFERLGGDSDALARIERGVSEEFYHSEWALLDQLIQKLVICQGGLASESFRIEALRELHSIAPDRDVQDKIMEMVGNSV